MRLELQGASGSVAQTIATAAGGILAKPSKDIAENIVKMQANYLDSGQVAPLLAACVSTLDHREEGASPTPFGEICRDIVMPNIAKQMDPDKVLVLSKSRRRPSTKEECDGTVEDPEELPARPQRPVHRQAGVDSKGTKVLRVFASASGSPLGSPLGSEAGIADLAVATGPRRGRRAGGGATGHRRKSAAVGGGGPAVESAQLDPVTVISTLPDAGGRSVVHGLVANMAKTRGQGDNRRRV